MPTELVDKQVKFRTKEQEPEWICEQLGIDANELAVLRTYPATKLGDDSPLKQSMSSELSKAFDKAKKAIRAAEADLGADRVALLCAACDLQAKDTAENLLSITYQSLAHQQQAGIPRLPYATTNAPAKDVKTTSSI